jgi:hypothetical protein
MEALLEREVLLERRLYAKVESILCSRLSLEQKFAASSMTQFGYDLSFIRNSNNGSLAILQCNGNAATINEEGEVNSTPSIIIRP